MDVQAHETISSTQKANAQIPYWRQLIVRKFTLIGMKRQENLRFRLRRFSLEIRRFHVDSYYFYSARLAAFLRTEKTKKKTLQHDIVSRRHPTMLYIYRSTE